MSSSPPPSAPYNSPRSPCNLKNVTHHFVSQKTGDTKRSPACKDDLSVSLVPPTGVGHDSSETNPSRCVRPQSMIKVTCQISKGKVVQSSKYVQRNSRLIHLEKSEHNSTSLIDNKSLLKTSVQKKKIKKHNVALQWQGSCAKPPETSK